MSPFRAMCLVPLLGAAVTVATEGVVGATERNAIKHWSVPAVMSPNWESHPAFDPRTGDLWFVRSDPKFSGWHLLVSRCERGSWQAPVDSPVSRPGLEADPWFAPDGKTLWFISTRRTGSQKSADLDIYRAERAADGTWGEPVALPAPVNSAAAEWFPRPAADGWLYFGSRRPGGLGQDDIWRARERTGRWVVENLGPDINSAGSEAEFAPAPGGRWGIISTDAGLVRAVASGSGWHRAQPLFANQNGSEIGPLIAPDGRSFMFSRDAGDGASGELFISQVAPGVDWTPQCPVHPSGR